MLLIQYSHLSVPFLTGCITVFRTLLQFPYRCSSLSMRDLYKIQGTITVLHILILMFLDSRRAEHVLNCRKHFPNSACLLHFHDCHFDLLLLQQIFETIIYLSCCKFDFTACAVFLAMTRVCALWYRQDDYVSKYWRVYYCVGWEVGKLKACLFVNTGQQRFCPKRKNVFLMYFWTLNSNMFPEFLSPTHFAAG
jgi:hypothetical protein